MPGTRCSAYRFAVKIQNSHVNSASKLKITGAKAVKAGLLSPPPGLAALDKMLLNTTDFANLLKEGISAGLSEAKGTGSFPRFETAAFSMLGSSLSAIGSLSAAH